VLAWRAVWEGLFPKRFATTEAQFANPLSLKSVATRAAHEQPLGNHRRADTLPQYLCRAAATPFWVTQSRASLRNRYNSTAAHNVIKSRASPFRLAEGAANATCHARRERQGKASFQAGHRPPGDCSGDYAVAPIRAFPALPGPDVIWRGEFQTGVERMFYNVGHLGRSNSSARTTRDTTRRTARQRSGASRPGSERRPNSSMSYDVCLVLIVADALLRT